MRHPYPIREIARQAGLSEATVDRVLNDRGGVRESTVMEVHQAIKDLDRQRTQVRIGGRTFMIDIVMQTPERFSTAVRDALEAELPSLHPAVVRPGRCLAQIEMGPLSRAEAAAWLGTTENVPETATLAELYAIRDGRTAQTPPPTSGTGFYL